MEDWNNEIFVGRRINNLRYAYDITIGKEELLKIMKRLSCTSEEYCLELNNQENKMLIVDHFQIKQPNVHTRMQSYK